MSNGHHEPTPGQRAVLDERWRATKSRASTGANWFFIIGFVVAAIMIGGAIFK